VGDQPSRIRVIIAAAIAAVFACAFLVVAVAISVDALTNHGAIGTAARNTNGGRFSPAAGVLMVALLLTLGAIGLIRGAVRALRRESYIGIVIPLGILLVVGTVGETIDLVGTASSASDAVGLGILFLAAVPIALLWHHLRETPEG
jgi:hypothetical protein